MEDKRKQLDLKMQERTPKRGQVSDDKKMAGVIWIKFYSNSNPDKINKSIERLYKENKDIIEGMEYQQNNNAKKTFEIKKKVDREM